MKRVTTIVSLAALALSGCGSDEDSVAVSNAWARTSAEGQTTGAIYFELEVTEDDTLLAASVPASVADHAEIHEVVPADTTASGGSMEGSMDAMESATDQSMDESMDASMSASSGDEMGGSGAMIMRELEDGLALEGGETVTFQPGGYHVMLLDLVEPLEVGDEIELTLDFAEADSLTQTVTVAESAP